MMNMDTNIEAHDILSSLITVVWSKQIEEYKTLFCVNRSKTDTHQHAAQPPMTILTSKALSGALKTSQIRSLCWKIFLGVLPESSKSQEWVQQMKQKRARYDQLIQVHIVDPRDLKSPWSQFFENSELEKVIEQDLLRLYPEHDFFREPETVKLMQRVLFLWSKENTDTSYRQGMHELLAPFVLVFHRDAKATKLGLHEAVNPEDEEAAATLRELFNDDYLEHDCYLAFERLMLKMKDYFQVLEIPREQRQKDVTGLMNRNALIDETISKTPIHQISHRIQFYLLSKKDKELHDHLKELMIEPQIYLLRWIRLLFGREFHLEDVMMIWDAIFADCGGFRDTEIDSMLIDLSLVEHISIMMLVYIRSQLLGSDYSSCLKRLMKYPPVEDVHMFIEKALQSRNNPNTKINFSSTESQPPSSSAQQQVVTDKQEKRSRKNSSKLSGNTSTGGSTGGLFGVQSNSLFKVKDYAPGPLNTLLSSSGYGSHTKNAPVSPSVTSSLFDTTPKAHSLFDSSSQQFIEKEAEIGGAMEKIIDLMQRIVLEREKGFDENSFFMSIAELKHIRDVLKFQLPYERQSLSWMDEIDAPAPTPSSAATVRSSSKHSATVATPQDPVNTSITVTSTSDDGDEVVFTDPLSAL